MSVMYDKLPFARLTSEVILFLMRHLRIYVGKSNENLKYVLYRNLLNTKVHNDVIFLCGTVLPHVGHSPNHQ